MKRVLVTGASGFIGRQTLELLRERGYEVHAVSSAPVLGRSGAIWHQTNLEEPEAVASLLGKVWPTHLLHLAWYVIPGRYLESEENLRWLAVSLDLLREFAAHGGKRVVMAGTCFEYEPATRCREDTTPLRPSSLYATCKHALQMVLFPFTSRAKFSAAWGRVFFLYGPHEHPSRLVPSVVRALLRCQPANCTHGRQIRDYLYVKDAASAFVALLDSDVKGPVNIASGSAVTLSTVVGKVATHLGRRELVRLGAVEAPANEPEVITADTTRLLQEVGWSPATPLDLGLEKTIAWWQEQLDSATGSNPRDIGTRAD